MEGPVTWTRLLLWAVVAVGAIAGVILSLVSLYLIYIYRKYAHIPSPPRESFFFGHAGSIARKMKKQGTFLHEIFLQYTQELGHTFVIFQMGFPLVFTVDQEAVKELLVTGNFRKSEAAYAPFIKLFGSRLIGSGLVTDTNTENWTKRRASMNPAFHRQLLRPLMAEFNQTGDDLMEVLAQKADGTTVITLMDYFNRLTLDVIGKVAFNMDINSLTDPSSPFPRAVFKTLHGISDASRSLISHKIPFVKQNFKQDVRDAIQLIRDTGRTVIRKREKEEKADLPIPQDVLSFIIKAQKTDPSMDMEEVLDHFITFFIAGQETTATLLTYVIRELGRYPDILQRVREEVEEVVGERHEVTYEDINKLEYCSLVIKETLRLFPPVPFTFRQVDEDQKVGGLMMPKGTTIMMSPYTSARIPEFTPDVLTFDPERFRLDSDRKPPTYAYFPFSLGPRNCIGMTFGQIEAKVILIKFIQRFDFVLDPTQSFESEEKTSLRPKDGARLTLSQRDP